jgi:hypothetical protein
MSELDEFMKVLCAVGVFMLGLCFVLFLITPSTYASGSSLHTIIGAFYHFVVTSPNLVKFTMVGIYLVITIITLCSSDKDDVTKFRDIVIIFMLVTFGWLGVDYLVDAHVQGGTVAQSSIIEFLLN